MDTATIAPRRSYSDAMTQGSGSSRKVTQGSGSRKEAPYKVGELVYATVLVDSPMSAFNLSCNPELSKTQKRQAKREVETRRLAEQKGEIGGKTPRPCVIVSTKPLPKDQWEYTLCLLTTFGNKAYSELQGDARRLALPVYQEGSKPNECADKTRIPAFVFEPPLKPLKPPKLHSYLIGYPITRSGSCIQSVFGDDKPVMKYEEVERLKRYCRWIREQGLDVDHPRLLPTRAATATSMTSQGVGSISRVDSPLSYGSTGNTKADSVAGPSGVSGSAEAEPISQKPAKRSSGDKASEILDKVLNSTEQAIKRVVDVVRRSISPK